MLQRNSGWSANVWNTYYNKRFKKNFRVTKGTFLYILNAISEDLQREMAADIYISPAFRRGIAMYRMARGDYLHTIAEMTGMGTATVWQIVSEVQWQL